MRLILGFILGVIVTVAAAYAYDAQTGRSVNGLTSAAAPLVNWDIVGDHWTTFQADMRAKAGDLERSLKRHAG